MSSLLRWCFKFYDTSQARINECGEESLNKLKSFRQVHVVSKKLENVDLKKKRKN